MEGRDMNPRFFVVGFILGIFVTLGTVYQVTKMKAAYEDKRVKCIYESKNEEEWNKC
jgi:hypothetical protein